MLLTVDVIQQTPFQQIAQNNQTVERIVRILRLKWIVSQKTADRQVILLTTARLTVGRNLMTKDEQITYLSSALIAIRDEYYPYHGENAVAIRGFAADTILQWQTKSAIHPIVQADMNEIEETINGVLFGIDLTETDDGEGWWETSEGAIFGRKTKELLISEIKRHLKR